MPLITFSPQNAAAPLNGKIAPILIGSVEIGSCGLLDIE